MGDETQFFPHEVLNRRAQTKPHIRAVSVLKLGDQVFDQFMHFTWSEIYERFKSYVNFVEGLHLKKGAKVVLIGRNSLEWVLIDWSLITLGLVSVPLFSQSHPDEIKKILEDSEADLIFCDEPAKDIPVKQIRFGDIESALKPAVQIQPRPAGPAEICTLIYTSGTSGDPKGVVHSLKNIQLAVQSALEKIRLSPRDRLFSYLPFSHVAERILVEFGCLYSGASMTIIDRVDRAIGYLPQTRPTVFFAVPRVWEAIAAKVDKELRSNQLLKRRLEYIPFFLRPFLLGYFIKRKIGLEKCRLAISGAAKLSESIFNKFDHWNLTLHEAYGLTETLCVSTFNLKGNEARGTVGQAYRGVELKIMADGEICIRAPFHFLGYYKKPDLTSEALKEGWFYTGDIGVLDKNKNLRITDRKKSLFKSSNGKYIAPMPIELLLKSYAGIREVLVVGENRAHCVAVASVEKEGVDERILTQHLEFVNSRLPIHEQIRCLGCVKRSWSTDSGELTPSLKVKRQVVLQNYKTEIEQLYGSSNRVLMLD